jgi:hypothetical protein
MATQPLLEKLVTAVRGAPSGVRVCRSAADLAGLQARDLVLVPGVTTEVVPAYIAERFLPPATPASAPAAIAWRQRLLPGTVEVVVTVQGT